MRRPLPMPEGLEDEPDRGALAAAAAQREQERRELAELHRRLGHFGKPKFCRTCRDTIRRGEHASAAAETTPAAPA